MKPPATDSVCVVMATKCSSGLSMMPDHSVVHRRQHRADRQAYANHRKSAVELLEASKGAYVKSRQVLNHRQELKHPENLTVGNREVITVPISAVKSSPLHEDSPVKEGKTERQTSIEESCSRKSPTFQCNNNNNNSKLRSNSTSSSASGNKSPVSETPLTLSTTKASLTSEVVKLSAPNSSNKKPVSVSPPPKAAASTSYCNNNPAGSKKCVSPPPKPAGSTTYCINNPAGSISTNSKPKTPPPKPAVSTSYSNSNQGTSSNSTNNSKATTPPPVPTKPTTSSSSTISPPPKPPRRNPNPEDTSSISKPVAPPKPAHIKPQVPPRVASRAPKPGPKPAVIPNTQVCKPPPPPRSGRRPISASSSVPSEDQTDGVTMATADKSPSSSSKADTSPDQRRFSSVSATATAGTGLTSVDSDVSLSVTSARESRHSISSQSDNFLKPLCVNSLSTSVGVLVERKCPLPKPRIEKQLKEFELPPRRQLHRSQSDLSSCRHSRASSDFSDLSSRLSRTSTEVERFFNEMGIDHSVLEPMRKLCDTRQKECLDSLSSLDSLENHSLSSQISIERYPMESEQDLSERDPGTTSVVERNARIIKWLCNVRKARTVQTRPTRTVVEAAKDKS